MNKKSVFETKGNVELLSQVKVGLFASRSAPKEIFPQALDLYNKLLNMPISIAGGWQAPLEKYLFKHARRSARANFIQYLAKNINNIKLISLQQELLDEKKLLLISPGICQDRASKSEIDKRDALIFSQIKKILFFYIEPKGRLEKHFNQLSSMRYQIYMLDHPLNKVFHSDDVIAINPDNALDILTG